MSEREQVYVKGIVRPTCPQCGSDLDSVEQSPPRFLNREQFDAVKKGDWFCVHHGENVYFWDRDVLLPDRRRRNRRAPAGESVTGWAIERDPEDGLVYITHPKWSLVGQGTDLVSAAQDMAEDLPGVFAAFGGCDDLGEEAQAMVAWIQEVAVLTFIDSP